MSAEVGASYRCSPNATKHSFGPFVFVPSGSTISMRILSLSCVHLSSLEYGDPSDNSTESLGETPQLAAIFPCEVEGPVLSCRVTSMIPKLMLASVSVEHLACICS